MYVPPYTKKDRVPTPESSEISLFHHLKPPLNNKFDKFEIDFIAQLYLSHTYTHLYYIQYYTKAYSPHVKCKPVIQSMCCDKSSQFNYRLQSGGIVALSDWRRGQV